MPCSNTQQGGDAHHAELPGQLRLLVHVHLAHLHIAALLGHFVHNGLSIRQGPHQLAQKSSNMDLKDIAGRMKVIEGNSVEGMSKLLDPVDVIYLDPMFPARQKSSLINKKLQLIQKLEHRVPGKRIFLMQLSEQIRIRSSSSVR